MHRAFPAKLVISPATIADKATDGTIRVCIVDARSIVDLNPAATTPF
jgi:hypothetical protein